MPGCCSRLLKHLLCVLLGCSSRWLFSPASQTKPFLRHLHTVGPHNPEIMYTCCLAAAAGGCCCRCEPFTATVNSKVKHPIKTEESKHRIHTHAGWLFQPVANTCMPVFYRLFQPSAYLFKCCLAVPAGGRCSRSASFEAVSANQFPPRLFQPVDGNDSADDGNRDCVHAVAVAVIVPVFYYDLLTICANMKAQPEHYDRDTD